MIPEFRIVTNGTRYSVEYKQIVETTMGAGWIWNYISHSDDFPYSQNTPRRTFDSVDKAQEWIDGWTKRVLGVPKLEIWTPIKPLPESLTQDDGPFIMGASK